MLAVGAGRAGRLGSHYPPARLHARAAARVPARAEHGKSARRDGLGATAFAETPASGPLALLGEALGLVVIITSVTILVRPGASVGSHRRPPRSPGRGARTLPPCPPRRPPLNRRARPTATGTPAHRLHERGATGEARRCGGAESARYGICHAGPGEAVPAAAAVADRCRRRWRGVAGQRHGAGAAGGGQAAGGRVRRAPRDAGPVPGSSLPRRR